MVGRAATWRTSVLLGLLLVPVLGLGWFVFDVFRPRPPLELLFQQVIRGAPISDVSGDDGWEHADVTDLICPRINAKALDDSGFRRSLQNYSEAAIADVWEVAQQKNFFAACATYSVRYLTIEIDRKTGNCRAHVQPRPFCAF